MKRSSRSRGSHGPYKRYGTRLHPMTVVEQSLPKQTTLQIVIPEHINIDGVDFDCFKNLKSVAEFLSAKDCAKDFDFIEESSFDEKKYEKDIAQSLISTQNSINTLTESLPGYTYLNDNIGTSDEVKIMRIDDNTLLMHKCSQNIVSTTNREMSNLILDASCIKDTTQTNEDQYNDVANIMDNIDILDSDEPNLPIADRPISPSVISRYMDRSLCARLRPYIPKSLRPIIKNDSISNFQRDETSSELNNEIVQKNRQILSKTIENSKVELINLKIDKHFGQLKKPTIPVTFSSYVSIGRARHSILKLISKILSSDYTLWRHMDVNYSSSILIRLQKTSTSAIDCIVANPNRLTAIDCEQRWKSYKEVCQFGSMYGMRFHAHQYEQPKSSSSQAFENEPVLPLILRRSSSAVASSSSSSQHQSSPEPSNCTPQITSNSSNPLKNIGTTVTVIKTSMRDVVDSFLKRKQANAENGEVSTIRIIAPAKKQKDSGSFSSNLTNSRFKVLQDLYNDLLSKKGEDVYFKVFAELYIYTHLPPPNVHIPVMNPVTIRFRHLCIKQLMKFCSYSNVPPSLSMSSLQQSHVLDLKIKDFLNYHFRNSKQNELSEINDKLMLEKIVHRQLLQIHTFTMKMLCWSTKKLKTVDYEPLKLYKHLFDIIQFSYYFNEPLSVKELSAFQLTLRRLYCSNLAEDCLSENLKIILNFIGKLLECNKNKSFNVKAASDSTTAVTTVACYK